MKKPAKQTSKKRGRTAALKSPQKKLRSATLAAHAQPIRKVTVNLPEKLLYHETLGPTELIREALKWYQHKRACEWLLSMRGKLKFDMTYKELKELRD
jgi:hypothetical protein